MPAHPAVVQIAADVVEGLWKEQLTKARACPGPLGRSGAVCARVYPTEEGLSHGSFQGPHPGPKLRGAARSARGPSAQTGA